MASKKKLRKRLREAEVSKTSLLSERNEIWDQYDDFQRWVRKHAPATLKRYGKELPKIRPKTMDQIMKHYYAPAIRAQLNQPVGFLGHPTAD